MRIENLWILFFLLLSCSINAQNRSAIDSLKSELKKDPTDSDRVKVLCNLALQYTAASPQDGLVYADQAEALSKKINYRNGLSEAYHVKSVLFNANKQPLLAFQFHQKERRAEDSLSSGFISGTTGRFKK